MRTVNFLSAAAILAATVMTSCSRSAEDVNSNDRVEATFSSAQASVETRVTDSNWAQDDPIGIYMVKADPGTLADGNILEGVSNRQYKASAGTSGGAAASFEQVGGTIYYPANDQDGNVINVKFIAYYPYDGMVNASFLRDINVSSQTDQSAIDFLYAPATGPYNKTSPGPVTLPFAHKLTKLEFIIGNGAGVTATLVDLKVEITGQLTASTLNLTNGSVTDDNTGGTAVIEALTAGSTTSATSEAIVLPAANVSAMKFVFTNASGEQFTAAVPDVWQGGKKYTYTVTLKKTEAVIEGEITAWGDVDVPGVIAD